MKTDIHHPIESFGIRQVSMSGIRIEKLEDRVSPTVPFPHRHDFWQIILVQQGSGIHQIDFNTFKVKPRQIFVIKPGQVHRWQMSKSIKGLIVEFGRTGQLQQMRDEFTMKTDDFREVETLALVMLSEFSNKKQDYDTSLRSLLSAFFVFLNRYGIDGNQKTTTVIDQFRQLLEKNFRNEHRVEFYADKIGITPKALTMQITRALGKAPRSIIQERFMMEARRYLAFSNLSIAEIGYELGFQDANYFTRFFRLHEKMTPAAFRKKNSI